MQEAVAVAAARLFKSADCSSNGGCKYLLFKLHMKTPTDEDSTDRDDRQQKASATGAV